MLPLLILLSAAATSGFGMVAILTSLASWLDAVGLDGRRHVGVGVAAAIALAGTAACAAATSALIRLEQ